MGGGGGGEVGFYPKNKKNPKKMEKYSQIDNCIWQSFSEKNIAKQRSQKDSNSMTLWMVNEKCLR